MCAEKVQQLKFLSKILTRKLLSLKNAIHVLIVALTILVPIGGSNKLFFAFLISFVVTTYNLTKVYGLFISLPLTLLYFLGTQLSALFIFPISSGVITRQFLAYLVVFVPIILSLATPGSKHKSISRIGEKRSLFQSLALISPAILSFIIFAKTILRYPAGWSFWALGGDARNHLALSLRIRQANGITETLLANGPIFPNSQLAFFTFLNPYQNNLQVFFQTISILEYFYLVLSSVLMGLFTKFLLGKSSVSNSIVILIASSIPFSGMYAGVLQRDGFFSISLLLPLILATCMLLAKLADTTTPIQIKSHIYYVGLLLVPILSLLTWTPFAIFGLLFAFFGYKYIKGNPKVKTRNVILIGVINIILGFYCLKPLIQFKSANGQLTSSGAITPPSMFAFLLVLVFFLISMNMQVFRNPDKTMMRFLLTLFSISGLLNLLLIGIQPFESVWNYYPSKYGWVWLVTSLPLLFACISVQISNCYSMVVRHQSLLKKITWKPIITLIREFTFFSAILLSLSILQPAVQSPWLHFWFNSFSKGQFGVYSQVFNGWAAPSPEVINRITDIKEPKRQPVFWQYFANPSDDRMANFLLVLYSFNRDGLATPTADKLSYWAYFEDPTQVKSLCDLIQGNQSALQVLTKTANIRRSLSTECKIESNTLDVRSEP